MSGHMRSSPAPPLIQPTTTTARRVFTGGGLHHGREENLPEIKRQRPVREDQGPAARPGLSAMSVHRGGL
jgi:hypothetical protein